MLQADSYRMYKFVMSALATLVTAYLLLVLMLTVALHLVHQPADGSPSAAYRPAS
ncbi:hypothetical protein MJ559_28790 [Klebsiella pneumoniae]|nr:hypothetical protein MJ559_28790 [Klebsiella pneumoniae]